VGYLHINNLYKDQTVLMFRECYALEKIHGTSAHLSWKGKEMQLRFFSGGESRERFVALFDKHFLEAPLINSFGDTNATIYGEACGGKQQGMSHTYGGELKFIGFDVKVGDLWLNVPNAEAVCRKLNIEFVDYVKCSTDLAVLDYERDKESVQAVRNGCGGGKMREGIIIKPLIELAQNNGERIIAKHKGAGFGETKTPRVVSPEEHQIMEDAKPIAEE
jgi:RNA ligase